MVILHEPGCGGSSPAEQIGALTRQGLFLDCRAQTLQRIAPRVIWRRYPPNAVIIDFDDCSTNVFLVTEGNVRVMIRTASGHEIILGDLGPGNLFGELAAIDGQRRSANVSALVQCRVCVLPDDVFRELVAEEPSFTNQVLFLLVARLRALTERLVEQEVLPVRLRLCAELLRLSRPREGGGAVRIISPPLPQHVLAARIGARREAVSREFAALERGRLIEKRRGSIVLHDPAALRALIDATAHKSLR